MEIMIIWISRKEFQILFVSSARLGFVHQVSFMLMMTHFELTLQGSGSCSVQTSLMKLVLILASGLWTNH